MTSLAFLAPVQVKTNDLTHDLNQRPKGRRGPAYRSR